MSTHTVELKDYKKSPALKSAGILGGSFLALGLVLGLGTWVSDPGRFWFSFLWMFVFVLSIGLGSLFFIGLEYLVGANWSTPVRRVMEILATLIPMLLFVAVILFVGGRHHLYYHWVPAHQEVSHEMKAADSHVNAAPVDAHATPAHAADPMIEGKRPYLNEAAFGVRIFLTFGLWTLFYFLFTFNSEAQDRDGDQKYTARNIKLSAVFILVFALTLTIGAVDWIMTLEPHWFSTMFGVYYFAGCLVASISVITIFTVLLKEGGYLHPLMSRHTYYNLGAFMFAFNTFWTYIAFSQFMLIWYANLPEETVWFAARYTGGWKTVSWVLLIGHFVIPFLGLLSRTLKTNPYWLLFWAFWLIGAQGLDFYWQIMPSYVNGSFYLMDIGFILFAAGLVVSVFVMRAKQVSLVPMKDPKLQLGLGFRLHN